MTWSQGPSKGPSATASISMTGEAGGWDWPRRVSMDKTDTTRSIKTVPEDTTRLKTCLRGHGTALLAGTGELDAQDLGTALLAVTTELDPLESGTALLVMTTELDPLELKSRSRRA